MLRWVLLAALVSGCAGEARAAPRLPAGFVQYGPVYMAVFDRHYGGEHHGIPWAQVEQESSWRRCPESPWGAKGLGQFIPSTWEAVHRKYGWEAGDRCNVVQMARAHGIHLRDLARSAGSRLRGFRAVWFATLRTYNGSPAAFWCEWRRAGRPTNTTAMEMWCGACGRPGWACRENLDYPEAIWRRWPKYREYLGS